MKSTGSYKEGPNAGGDGLTTGARRRILTACSDGRNSLEDDQHPAHGEFHSIAKEVGGQWSEDSSTNIRNQDLSSALPAVDRPNARDIRQTSAQPEPSHYSPVKSTSTNANAFQKAAKAGNPELEARRDATVKDLYKQAARETDRERKAGFEKLAIMLDALDLTKRVPRFLSGSRPAIRRSYAERHAG